MGGMQPGGKKAISYYHKFQGCFWMD